MAPHSRLARAADTTAGRYRHSRRPAAATRSIARASDAVARSNATIRASGLLRARLTVCAPVPQPTSSTRLPGGNLVSPWSRHTTEEACASRRSLSRSPYPWMYTKESSAGVTPPSWTLLQPCGPPPRSGGEAELPRKHARHVTLVGETGRRRCRRERTAVTNQHPRTLGAAAQQPCVGRQSIGSLEAAQHLITAQPREPGQVCETGHSRRI